MEFGGLETLLAGLGSLGIIALALVLGVVGAVYALVAQRRRGKDPEVLAAADRLADQRRGWVQGATFILQRGWDNAYVEADVIRTMLGNAWGLNSAEELQAQVSTLLSEGDDAWTLLRAMLLVRSAVAVGWMTNDASFLRCYEIGGKLQQRYPSWAAMSADVLRSRRERFGMPIDGSADNEGMAEVAASAAYLAKTHWKEIPWQLTLS